MNSDQINYFYWFCSKKWEVRAPATFRCIQVNKAHIHRLLSRAGAVCILLNLRQATRTGFKGALTSSASRRWDNMRPAPVL